MKWCLIILAVCLFWAVIPAQSQVKLQAGVGGSLPEFSTAFAHGAVVIDLPMGFKFRPNIGIGRNSENGVWLMRSIIAFAHPIYRNILLGCAGGVVFAFTPNGVKAKKLGAVVPSVKYRRIIFMVPIGVEKWKLSSISLELAYTF